VAGCAAPASGRGLWPPGCGGSRRSWARSRRGCRPVSVRWPRSCGRSRRRTARPPPASACWSCSPARGCSPHTDSPWADAAARARIAATGKLERLFRTVREQFLVELEGRQLDSLEELNRLFQAWPQEAHHRRSHSERGETPLARYTAQQPRRADAGDDPELLRQAFLWRETRTVSKAATVSLSGNRHGLDAALVGCRVELLFDPFDRERIEVRYQGRPFGLAVPHTIGRHAHPQAAREPHEAEPPPKTGIDYLRLLEEEHEQALRRQISYRDLAPGEERR